MASKLISKTDLITAIRDDVHIRGVSFARVKKHIEDAPIVDAVEVVRCKDCDKSKRSHLFGSGWRFCMNNSQHHKDNHFCSYGERRTDKC